MVGIVGALRTDAYAPASVCTPTRYSLLTGQYPWRRNATGLNKGVANGDSPLLISLETPILPGLLKGAGYRTGIVGKWHLGFTNGQPDYNKGEALAQGLNPMAAGRQRVGRMSGTGERSIRQGPWKLIPDLSKAHGWKGAP